jgi:hypothetical protein
MKIAGRNWRYFPVFGIKTRRAPKTFWSKIDTSELAVTKMAAANTGSN